MEKTFKTKIYDIFNSSFTEKIINKSQNNILTETDLYIEKRLKKSNSNSKYNKILEESNFKNSASNKENIQDLLNKSFGELRIKKKSNYKETKNYFDNISNSTFNYFGNNYYINDINYNNIFNNINKRNKKKKKEILLGRNKSKETNLFNNNKKDNSYQLKKKIFNLTNEIKTDSNINYKSYINKPISNLENYNYYNTIISERKMNNLTKGDVSKLYEKKKNKSIDFFKDNYHLKYNHKFYSNYGVQKDNLNEFKKGFKSFRNKNNIF